MTSSRDYDWKTFTNYGGSENNRNGRKRSSTNDGGSSARRSQKASSIVDKNEPREPSSLSKIFSRFADRTSMQGIPYVFQSKLMIARVIWLLLTIAAIVISVVHMYTLIELYYQYSIQTKLSLGFSVQELPAVTFCNVNAVKKTEVGQSEDLQRLVDRIDPDTQLTNMENDDTYDPETDWDNFEQNITDDVDYEDVVYDIEDEDEYEYDEDWIGPIDVTEEIKNKKMRIMSEIDSETKITMGHKLEDMMVRCTIKGRKCSPQNFTQTYSTNYGNCYTLKPGKFVADKSGPDKGLTMILYMEPNEYIGGFANGQGIRLAIHQTKTAPFPHEEGFFVSSGKETNIGLRLTSIERMGKPFGTCVTNDHFMKNFNIKYTRQACQKLCQQTKIFDKCGCYSYMDEDILYALNIKVTNKAKCLSKKQIMCQYGISELYRNQTLKCVCDDPCTERDYRKTISQIDWPAYTYSKLLVGDLCKKTENAAGCNHATDLKKDANLRFDLQESFLKVNIYFEDLNYQVIKETQDYEDIQFLSDVGGAIGLWIGLSILSIFEVLQLFVELGNYCLYVKHCEKRQDDEDRDHEDRDKEYETYETGRHFRDRTGTFYS